MIPSQTFTQFPVFGDSATKTQPDDAKYSDGFVPADVLPAVWENWLWNKSTNVHNEVTRGLTSVETELNAVVAAGGATPAEGTTNQVINAIKYLIAEAKAQATLDAHPVHDVVTRVDDVNPGTLYGGTWEQIAQGRCLIGAGTGNDGVNAQQTFTVGATGGKYLHQLTSSELPQHYHVTNTHTHTMSHTHNMAHYHNRGTMNITGKFRACTSGGAENDDNGVFTAAGYSSANYVGGNSGSRQGYNLNASKNWTGLTSNVLNSSGSAISGSATGGASTSTTSSPSTTAAGGLATSTGAASSSYGSSHTNVQPYVVVTFWKRTA